MLILGAGLAWCLSFIEHPVLNIHYGFFSSMELRVKRAPRIDIEIRVPADKSISHRAVVICALSHAMCSITAFLSSEDCMDTVQGLVALGIPHEHAEP